MSREKMAVNSLHTFATYLLVTARFIHRSIL